MPFEAAKAIASAFCWKIRFVLTPIFGSDFPATCAKPGDAAYQRCTIKSEIIQRCIEQAAATRQLSRETSITRDTHSPLRNQASHLWTPKYDMHMNSDQEAGSERESDTRSSFDGAISWTSINRPPPRRNPRHRFFPTPSKTPEGSDREIQTVDRSPLRKRAGPEKPGSKNKAKKAKVSVPRTQEDRHKQGHSSHRAREPSQSELTAAKALIALHKGDSKLEERVKKMSRRASA